MRKNEYLKFNDRILQNKVVLDLACHSGESTELILKNGAQHVYAVDIRDELIYQAKNNITSNVDFFVGDITDPNLIAPLVAKSQVITCFGVLYHLFDHFRFFSHILKPNIEYVLIETVFGPETTNPEMVWGFETVDNILHGWANNCNMIPHGTPNLSWIINSARIFGFECDWCHCYGQPQKFDRKNLTHEEYITIRGESWPPYTDIISEGIEIPQFVIDEIDQMMSIYPAHARRMILRLCNLKTVDSTPLDIENIYRWPL
jgi:SAM-dependent methyltransferase